MQAELWTLSGLAVELGRDRRSLARDLEGLDPDKTDRKGGRVERRWRMRRAVEHLYRVSAGAEGEDFDDQRQRLAAAQAEKVERENAVRRGELVEASKVVAGIGEHIAAARAKLLSMPTKLGPQLLNIQDANLAASRIRSEVYAALTELADWELPEASGDSGDGGGAEAGDADLAPAAAAQRQRVVRSRKAAQ